MGTALVGFQKDQRYSLTFDERFVLGRQSEGMDPKDMHVSRTHAGFTLDSKSNKVMLEVLSQNPVRVIRISGQEKEMKTGDAPVALAHGDLVLFVVPAKNARFADPNKYRFRVESEPWPAPRPPPSPKLLRILEEHGGSKPIHSCLYAHVFDRLLRMQDRTVIHLYRSLIVLCLALQVWTILPTHRWPTQTRVYSLTPAIVAGSEHTGFDVLWG